MDSSEAAGPHAPRTSNWTPFVVTGLLCAALLVGGHLSRGHANAAVATTATGDASLPLMIFVPAKRGKDSADVTLPASIHAFQETTVYARTAGYVKRWAADIGDHVKAGQVLAELDAPELDHELEQARASAGQARAHLQLARSTAERYRALAKEDAVSAQEVDERNGALAAREADVAATQAKVRQLESMKSLQRVVAPFAGTVTARNVEIGSLVTPGSSSATPWLYKLAQSDTLRVFVSVPQNQLAAVKSGTEAELSIRELGGKPIVATVARNAGAFDPVTRTMLTELRVPNPDGRIFPGMYGKVKFHVKYADAPIVVPVNALLVGGAGPRIAVVDERDVVHVRPVVPGRDLGKEIEILDGLADNDRVITNPRDDVGEGAKVKAVHAPKRDEKKSDEKKADEKKHDAKDAKSADAGHAAPSAK